MATSPVANVEFAVLPVPLFQTVEVVSHAPLTGEFVVAEGPAQNLLAAEAEPTKASTISTAASFCCQLFLGEAGLPTTVVEVSRGEQFLFLINRDFRSCGFRSEEHTSE